MDQASAPLDLIPSIRLPMASYPIQVPIGIYLIPKQKDSVKNYVYLSKNPYQMEPNGKKSFSKDAKK